MSVFSDEPKEKAHKRMSLTIKELPPDGRPRDPARRVDHCSATGYGLPAEACRAHSLGALSPGV